MEEVLAAEVASAVVVEALAASAEEALAAADPVEVGSRRKEVMNDE